MDEERQRILEDLSGALEGDLLFDAATLSLYATDASLHRVLPLGVVRPRVIEDVITTLRYCSEQRVPVIPRGSGTGLAGGAIGPGLILDFSAYMREILEIGSDSIRVQAGATLDQINRSLKSHGTYLPPDPANYFTATIGGMLGVDAAGSHAIRVGSMRDYVRSITSVLIDGRVAQFHSVHGTGRNIVPSSDPPQQFAENHSGIFHAMPLQSVSELRTRLGRLLSRHRDLIEQRFPRTPRNTCGYYLPNVFGPKGLDVPRLLVGAEGTLTVNVEAELATLPIPEFRGMCLFLFPEMNQALEAVEVITAHEPSACDLMDRRIISLARETEPKFKEILDASAEAAIIVEQVGLNQRDMRSRLSHLVREISKKIRNSKLAYTSDDPHVVDWLWSLPRRVVPLLARVKGERRPLPIIEDIAVPPAAISPFLHEIQRVFQRYSVTVSLYAHAATGQLHLRPFLPSPAGDDGLLLETLSRDIYQIVQKHGGSISGEHGDGYSRTAFIRTQYGPLYRVFQEIKDLFDPHNLLNPGKIISDDPSLTRRHLRAEATTLRDLETISLETRWSSRDAFQAASECNGCGSCKDRSEQHRMCPFYKLQPLEEFSPRAKANLYRELMKSSEKQMILGEPQTERLLNSCFHCQQCVQECPAEVDVSRLTLELRGLRVQSEGLSRKSWYQSRVQHFSKWASRFPFAFNRILSHSPTRWLLERTMGLARKRKLPKLASRSFLGRHGRRIRDAEISQLDRGTVVYFVDTYANYHDPELAEAFLNLMGHFGTPVIVPAEQTFSGMALLTSGDLASAKQTIERNLKVLAPLAMEGFPIICTEPSAALALKIYYPMLSEHPDAQLVADQSMEAGALIAELSGRTKGQPGMQPVEKSLRYHLPCHVRTLQGASRFLPLVESIPGIKCDSRPTGCSGMAGAFGLSAANFETSMAMGEPLFAEMAKTDYDLGLTECTSCKIQMEQNTRKPTIHPIKLLAYAYGLMPSVSRILEAKNGQLTVS